MWAHRRSSEPVIDFRNLTISPPGRNMPIVFNSNLRVAAGTLVSLMGGSGCGKTTLMMYLTRRMRDLHQWGVTADKAEYPESVAFVAQKEMFYPFDTAFNHLLFIRQRHFVESVEESKAVARKGIGAGRTHGRKQAPHADWGRRQGERALARSLAHGNKLARRHPPHRGVPCLCPYVLSCVGPTRLLEGKLCPGHTWHGAGHYRAFIRTHYSQCHAFLR